MRLRMLLLVPILLTFAPAGQGHAQEPAAALLAQDRAPVVFNVLYRWGQVTSAPDGAVGPNVHAGRTWYIEYQRGGSTDVIDGVLRGDGRLVAAGLRMFHWGLAREAPGGSFPGSAWPFHGTALFLSQAAPALLILGASPAASRYAHETEWESVRVRKAAYAMVRSVGGPNRIDDTTKNHRYFEAALALGAAGVLSGDKQLVRWSQTYAWKGIHMARPDGVMPEDGGHDSGYQAVGMSDALQYLALSSDSSLRRTLMSTMRRAEAWELSRVAPDGTIDQSGDTRTAGCRERDPEGNCKTTFYAPIFDALARWAAMSGDERFTRAAYRVWLQNWQMVPGDVLPPAGLWVRPDVIARNGWLTVSGARFAPLENVRLYVGSVFIVALTCDQTGSFGGHSPVGNAYFRVPDLPPGRYAVTARGDQGTVRRTQVTISS